MDYRLSPSDLTFLYDGCKHCFVLKVKHRISQPTIPLPGVFSTIASLQKNYYSGKRTEDFCPQLPPGRVTLGEKQVRSSTIKFDGLDSTCHITGRFDIIAELDDKSYAVMDFKTGNPSEETADMYGRQLHAYAYALENPAEGALKLNPVTRMGLLYFTPDNCNFEGDNRQILGGQMTWVEIKRDDTAFNNFLREVVSLLDGEMPTAEPDKCNWCRYCSKILDIPSSTGQANKDGDLQLFPPDCPQCGSTMRLRKGKYGDFWGCSNYPNCRGTQQV